MRATAAQGRHPHTHHAALSDCDQDPADSLHPDARYARRARPGRRSCADFDADFDLRCRSEPYFGSRAAPLRGTAGAPVTGLCAWGARSARARRRRQLAREHPAHSPTGVLQMTHLPRPPLSSSQAPRLGRPAGVASRWLRQPRPGTHSQGFGAYEEDGERAGRLVNSLIVTEDSRTRMSIFR